MNLDEIKQLCYDKQEELMVKYFGNFVYEAAYVRPETIGEYTPDMPLKIESEYKDYLKKLWQDSLPEEMKGAELVLEERKLRMLKTGDDRELIASAYKEAKEQTLYERITKSNHEDVTYYKGLLKEYTKDLLMVAGEDFLEEITKIHIKNKTFEED